MTSGLLVPGSLLLLRLVCRTVDACTKHVCLESLKYFKMRLTVSQESPCLWVTLCGGNVGPWDDIGAIELELDRPYHPVILWGHLDPDRLVRREPVMPVRLI